MIILITNRQNFVYLLVDFRFYLPHPPKFLWSIALRPPYKMDAPDRHNGQTFLLSVMSVCVLDWVWDVLHFTLICKNRVDKTQPHQTRTKSTSTRQNCIIQDDAEKSCNFALEKLRSFHYDTNTNTNTTTTTTNYNNKHICNLYFIMRYLYMSWCRRFCNRLLLLRYVHEAST